jgi:broad specificity phosphatase PhoE
MAELSCGEWEGRARDSVLGETSLLRTTWTDRPPSGESYQDAELRVASMIEEIRSLPDSRIVMVVAHASVNRVFLKLWRNLDPQVALQLRVPHDRVYVLGHGEEVICRSAMGRESRGLLFDYD